MIIMNEGGGYVSGLNEFWCPVDGLYYFIHSTSGDPGNRAITEIWMDETPLVTAFAYDYGKSASNSVFAHCRNGSKVYVQCGQLPCRLWGTDNGYVNIVTFSGMLVRSDV